MRFSLLIARVGGTDIRLHWTMLLILPYVYLAFRPADPFEAVRVLLIIGLVFLSVLIHELGHLAVAKIYHVGVSSVVLWALGGAAVTEHDPDDPGAQLFIAVAGPIANLLVAAILLIGLAGMGLLAIVTHNGLDFPPRNLFFLIITNLILAFSNLFPIYPLDGGRIFKALVDMAAGPARSVQITFWISVIMALGLSTWAVLERSWLLFGTALLLIMGSLTLNQALLLQLTRVYARWFQRPDLFVRLSDFDPAVQILMVKIDRDPQNPDLYLQRAYAYYFLEDFFHARADVERVLGLDPTHLVASVLRGAIFYAMEMPAEAWNCAEEVERRRPGWSLVHLNRGVLLRDEGRLHEALEEANCAIEAVQRERGPLASPVLAHLLRSNIRMRMGDLAGTEMDWAEAMRLNSREAVLFTPDRARIFARDWSWAEAYFAWLKQRGGDPALLPVVCGETALRAGKFSRAVDEFSQAIRRHPALRDLCYYRGWAYQEMGDREKATADFQLAIQVSARAHIRRLAGMRLKQLTALHLSADFHNQ